MNWWKEEKRQQENRIYDLQGTTFPLTVEKHQQPVGVKYIQSYRLGYKQIQHTSSLINSVGETIRERNHNLDVCLNNY